MRQPVGGALGHPGGNRLGNEFSYPVSVVPNDVAKAIVCHGVDMQAMAAFMGTAEFEARTSSLQSGVTLYELSELAPPAH
jgi:hypothetical protein